MLRGERKSIRSATLVTSPQFEVGVVLIGDLDARDQVVQSLSQLGRAVGSVVAGGGLLEISENFVRIDQSDGSRAQSATVDDRAPVLPVVLADLLCRDRDVRALVVEKHPVQVAVTWVSGRGSRWGSVKSNYVGDNFSIRERRNNRMGMQLLAVLSTCTATDGDG